MHLLEETHPIAMAMLTTLAYLPGSTTYAYMIEGGTINLGTILIPVILTAS